ncbi:MAG: hypothetical protein K2Y42_12510 [Hyphomicrobium sp.]|jgi:hypothetical protein|uniref:hypothetical protein n=1 Tax=Hyphomicrobium sp. TaxID=82 RepID=UPI0025C26C7B|nr:hypothetical protein [Hyphomicrobium sp.]MBX9863562.1 hypothetical protein [Hyphomicrobium sp.]
MISRPLVCFVFATLIAAGSGEASAQSERPCVKSTEPVAGELRKVTTRRPTTRELITNWHIVSPELMCIETDAGEANGITDIEVIFSKSVDLKKLDDMLGMSVGVKGKIVDARDDADTAIVVVLDAELYDDLDDSGMVRRK